MESIVVIQSSKVFISYSHRGNGLKWKEELLKELAVFERHGVLDVWHDDEMKLGENWHARINAAMKDAGLAVLLLTNEFLKSEFVRVHELPELARRHKQEGLIVAPILCEPCDWATQAWVASLQIKPRVQTDPTPLARLKDDAKRALRLIAVEIAEELSQVALAHLPKSEQAPSSEGIYLEKFPLPRGPGLREERLIGREQELALLDLAFAQPHTAIVSLVAWGGVGKTMLVQHWLRRLEREGWFGAQRIYGWSFYSRGTKEDRQASEDTFLAHALAWFGVRCEPTLSPWDKGRLLADAVARERTLLILDGIEPLQYPPGPMGGQLRAPGVQSLLKHLAREANAAGVKNPGSAIKNGLCLTTTREPLTDLGDFQRRAGSPWGSVLRVDLGNLTEKAGAALLHHVGSNRAGAAEVKPDDKELLAASREVDGHALTLNLLGRFLARAHGGDIRRRDLVKFEEADRKQQGGTTFKMLAAFENWFATSGEFGARQLAILRMLGLFDRPADAGCIAALREPPVITGLTDPLFTTKPEINSGLLTLQPLLEEDWNTATSFLADFGLIVIQTDGHNRIRLLDCHPLIREYFAQKSLAPNAEAGRVAHRRLYKHLCETAPEWTRVEYVKLWQMFPGQKPARITLEDLQPLYQALGHACHAGLQQEACDDVYWTRITRGEEKFAIRRLGAVDADLAGIACFFQPPWGFPSPMLKEVDQTWLLNQAGFRLRALARLSEALEPLGRFVEKCDQMQNWRAATDGASNLSEVELTLGNVPSAVRESRRCVMYADRSGDAFQRMHGRARLADALHQSGRRADAEALFREAEDIHRGAYSARGVQPEYYALLYGLAGYLYCNLLLAFPMRVAAWASLPKPRDTDAVQLTIRSAEALQLCRATSERAEQTLIWAERQNDLLPIGLDHLTLGCSELAVALLEGDAAASPSDPGGGKAATALARARIHLTNALVGLRRAGDAPRLLCGLLAHAWLRVLYGEAAEAQGDLDEAWDIAERGQMRLHMADIHLYRARLFFRERSYPWKSPQGDLAATEKLVNECGYHRRDDELADAKRAIIGS